MLLQYLFALAAILGSFQTHGSVVDIGTGPLDCVRIRSASMRRLIYGTGYIHDSKQRYMAIYNEPAVPHNSAFRIERISEYKEPLYYIKMINTREYVYGGNPSTATHFARVPVFSYTKANTTLKEEGVWMFQKVIQNKVWLGGWLIKNAYYDVYMIASPKDSEPPPSAKNAKFNTLKLDRNYQPVFRDDHMFFFEEC